SNVQVLGTVNGDVFAAGNTVTISGTVTGGVYAAGNAVSITGDVQHGVHAAGGTLTIAGPVAQDAVIAGGTLSLAPGARIGRDVFLAGANGDLAAPVGRNLQAAANELTLANTVGGDVQARVDTLRLTDASRVGGTLTYTSNAEAEVVPGATVGGGIQHLLPLERTESAPAVVNPASAVLDWVRGLVGLAVVGVLLTLLFPRFSEKTIGLAKGAYWQSLGIGVALFVCVPIAAVMVAIVGILIGGWMLGFAIMALFAMACAIGFTVAAMVAGNVGVDLLRQPRQHLLWNLLEGLMLFGLIGLIPLVGGVLMFVACAYGLGAFVLSIVASYRATPATPVGLEPAESTPERPTHLAAA
ncbi:MAG: hypothetical protein J2P17_32860, partial [Mycobacterium sp.]|nr:hypothetical protein [Mycobacterium sp.]